MNAELSVNIEDNSGKIIKGVEGAISKSMDEIGAKWKDISASVMLIDMGIYDTGALIQSRGYTTTSDSVTVGTGVDYSTYVHNGTSKMAPRPYLNETVISYLDVYAEICQKNIQKAIQ